ncbi:OLC1v1002839C1 [Oldenlandia corymbosa var. corymbosa]|uniref:OLC1v1002839C1 n=1 Tax=Oldenlandia corymbosa var. corymbosa TaxID=529605 RepID=A0AAV1D8V3_OLDCO|nr:OLC1v1002839C1 [Oldenlandia corymbosa var. corymbosa]
MARIHQGRRKIEMKKIEKESCRNVTFAKRRSSLMKKASELCILCDAKVAFIFFSPKNKVYSFASPNLESVIDDYIKGNTVRFYGEKSVQETHQAAVIQNLHKELERVEDLLEAEQQQRKFFDDQKNSWLERPIEDLNLQQLEQLMKEMEGLKMKVGHEIARQRVEAAANNPTFVAKLPGNIIGNNNELGHFTPYGVPMARSTVYGPLTNYISGGCPLAGPSSSGHEVHSPANGGVAGGSSSFRSLPYRNDHVGSSGLGYLNFHKKP